MPDASRCKRRKTRGSFEMMGNVAWPSQTIPVELFSLIIAHLPRSSIQNLRLVNKEFDRKVSEILFKIVVVPFRPEIYGIASETELSNELPNELPNEISQSSVMLQDKGMKVFQGFGKWIRKFALSFEIDQSKLIHPPLKCDQQAVVTFWGIYRWPFKTYNRYSQLEGLEQTADETKSMSNALRCITSANELGLSIDCGLGWLDGPDINPRVAARGEKPAVFGESKFVPEPKGKPVKRRKSTKAAKSDLPAQPNTLRASCERMLQDAGYTGEDLEPTVLLMLENEKSSDAFLEQENLRAAFNTRISELWGPTQPQGSSTIVSIGDHPSPDDSAASPPNSAISSGEEESEIEVRNPQTQVALSDTASAKNEDKTYPLKPSELTNAQKEMLLEMEWAQNAFMQSYVIAVMDNSSTFQRIRALNIARLPARHVPILCRSDFWDSLPQLNKLSLAVIPDWRKVVKEETNWVQDTMLRPSASVSAVYKLLQEQISGRQNITTLHFEWLCGGEYAPGVFSRNKNVLAAPIVSDAIQMINRTRVYDVLTFPHIQHLSLKNCWVSPHVIMRFLLSLKLSGLESLALDSVSLTASIPPNTQPHPINNATIAQNIMNVVAAAPAPAAPFVPPVPAAPVAPLHNNILNNVGFGNPLQNVQNVVAAPPAAAPNNAQNPGPNWSEPPRPGSWCDIIDTFSPGITLASIRHTKDTSGPDPPTREPSELTKLTFTSCGYLRLPMNFEQSHLDPPLPQPQLAGITRRINDIEGFMMKPQDCTLGIIVNYIRPLEKATLENAWNMTLGWGTSLRELTADARLDGVQAAGRGRFSGLIEDTTPPSTTKSRS